MHTIGGFSIPINEGDLGLSSNLQMQSCINDRVSSLMLTQYAKLGSSRNVTLIKVKGGISMALFLVLVDVGRLHRMR